MQEYEVIPFIRAIEEDVTFSEKKKRLLSTLVLAAGSELSSVPLKKIHKLSEISTSRIYFILTELEKEGFLSRSKKGHNMYIDLNKDALNSFLEKHSKDNLTQDVITRLRQASCGAK